MTKEQKYLNLFYDELTLQNILVGFIGNPNAQVKKEVNENCVLFYDEQDRLVGFNLFNPKRFQLNLVAGINAPNESLIKQLNQIMKINLNEYANLYPFVIGKIKTIKPIAKSHLNFCEVDVGKNALQKIVCGAINVRQDQYVVVVLPNACIPTGKFINSSKVLDHQSDGMICSAKELNLPAGEPKTILELPESLAINKIGQPYLVIYNIDPQK
ncbi:YtpR family tRNA-binding protein [Mycoplasma amphoriforme]|uniref:tRNA-binding domain-containing protein n=1 Tax=Mycoplasma amphoriforme A39 TaxID=572419 RepID=A0A292IIB6_9MOLU|nr:unnamed protein product [Mycoplasma amphoriforme A39]